MHVSTVKIILTPSQNSNKKNSKMGESSNSLGHLMVSSSIRRFLADIWLGLSRTNTLPYCVTTSVTKKTFFITQAAPGRLV